MDTKGILTLQFGHYSNFVGTHWWNIQEQSFNYDRSFPSEINNDILYREGLTDKNQVTFTPRLLLVDLKGSLNYLPEHGDLYSVSKDISKVNVKWDTNLIEIEQQHNEKNQFLKDLNDPEKSTKVLNNSYNLDKDVSVWSDFLYARFHPRTVNIIGEFQMNNEQTPFDAYPLGVSLWKSGFGDDFSNKIRIYVEECDYFQGFHLLNDCTNAFSGLSASCMEHLQDDYCGKSILAFPVIPSFFPDSKFETKEQQCHTTVNESVRVLNLALGFNSFNDYSSLFIPLSAGSGGWRQPGPKHEFYHTVYNPELSYHSSAILASTLDTITLKHRLNSSNFSLIDLCVDLSRNSRKAAAASICLPFSFNVDSNLLDCLDNWEGPLTKSITPNCKIGNDRLMQYITLRGISEDKLKQPLNKAGKQRDLPAFRCDTISEMLNLYLSYLTHRTINNVTVVQKPLDVKTPFPKIFDNMINQSGYVCSAPRSEQINVQSVPVMAGLHSGSEVGNMLESLYTEARRIKYRRFHQFINEGIDENEYKECLESLITLRENYLDSYYI